MVLIIKLKFKQTQVTFEVPNTNGRCLEPLPSLLKYVYIFTTL